MSPNLELRRNGWTVVLIILFGAAQCAWSPGTGIRGVHPDFVLIIALILCQFSTLSRAAAIGFAAGIISASLASPAAGGFGSIVVSRTITCIVVGWMEERVFREHFLTALAIVTAGTASSECLFFIFDPQRHVGVWARSMLLEVVYNGALTLPIFVLAKFCLSPRKSLDARSIP